MPADPATAVADANASGVGLPAVPDAGAVIWGEVRTHILPVSVEWAELPHRLRKKPVLVSDDWLNVVVVRRAETSDSRLPDPNVVETPASDWHRLRERLHCAFRDEPFEEGASHPADEILSAALLADTGNLLLGPLHDYCVGVPTPSYAVETLFCLARIESPGTSEWRVALVRGALRRKDIGIRDAALQAVERWEERSVVPVLRSHRESEEWLREYLEEVIRYLDE